MWENRISSGVNLNHWYYLLKNSRKSINYSLINNQPTWWQILQILLFPTTLVANLISLVKCLSPRWCLNWAKLARVSLHSLHLRSRRVNCVRLFNWYCIKLPMFLFVFLFLKWFLIQIFFLHNSGKVTFAYSFLKKM